VGRTCVSQRGGKTSPRPRRRPCSVRPGAHSAAARSTPERLPRLPTVDLGPVTDPAAPLGCPVHQREGGGIAHVRDTLRRFCTVTVRQFGSSAVRQCGMGQQGLAHGRQGQGGGAADRSCSGTFKGTPRAAVLSTRAATRHPEHPGYENASLRAYSVRIRAYGVEHLHRRTSTQATWVRPGLPMGYLSTDTVYHVRPNGRRRRRRRRRHGAGGGRACARRKRIARRPASDSLTAQHRRRPPPVHDA
jgi:hypothetical protein